MDNSDQYKFETAIEMAAPCLIQLNKKKELERIKVAFESSNSTPACILVCGEFKRGKSTFINALIGEKVCATDTDICTSVVSIIKYSPNKKLTRYFGDFSNIKSEIISFEDLEKYTVGNADEIDNTIYVEIELPLPFLKNSIVIDTPGVGGLDPRHATLTNYFLPKADITLFMTDVNEPLTTTELDFYKNKVLPYSKHSAIIINKSDLKDKISVEDIRLDTISKIAAYTQEDICNIHAISVSSAAEVYADNNLGESNFDELQNLMKSLINDYRMSIKSKLKTDFVELLDLVITPFKIQLNQIEQPDVNLIDSLVKQKKELDCKLSSMSNPNSDFRNSITKILMIEREKIANQLNENSVILQSDIFTTLLNSSKARNKDGGQWLGTKINDAIAEISSNLTMELNNTFNKISTLPEFEGMLNFEIKNYSGQIIIKDVNNNVPINRRITPLMSGVGIMTFGFFYLATGPLGDLAALGIGAYVAYKNQKDSSNSLKEQSLRQVYQPQLASAINNLNTYVNTRFQEFQQEWLRVVTDKIVSYKESIQESIMKIQEIKTSINQSVNMRIQIQNRIKPLVNQKEIAMK